MTRRSILLFTLVVMAFVASVHAAGPAVSLNYVPGEVIVQFRPDCVVEEQQPGGAILQKVIGPAEIHERLGSSILREFSPRVLPGLQLARISEGITVEDAIAKYREDPCVEFAEPNYIGEYTETIPSDTNFNLQWAHRNTGQTGGTADADIDSSDAWDLMTGSTAVLIALPDSGTEITHPDLAANIWTNPGEIPANGLDDDSNGFIDDVQGWDFEGGDNDVSSTNTHGTHCAGIIGAEGNNAQGVSGAMWTTRILPLKIGTGAPTTANAVDAILYANAMNADVISCSWNVGDSTALSNAITASNALVVVAAGNSGVDLDPSCNVWPACYAINNILVVTGTDDSDGQAYNYGATSADVGAPGVSIYSTVIGGTYDYMSGTSMATPLTASVAGMIKARDPSLTNTGLKSVIMNTVDVIPSLTGKCVSNGRINLYSALLSTDDTAPVTTITVTGTMPCPPWYNGPVTVSFSATDDFSLVETTEYSLNGGGWTAYAGPFPISAEGTTTVSYRSTDHAGNVETAKEEIIRIDSVAPDITGAPTTLPNANGWYNTDVTVDFVATDGTSGVKSVIPDEVTLSSEGAGQSVTGTAEDNACNTESFTVTGINIDKTPPVVIIMSPEDGREYAINEPVVADWSVTDALSGVMLASGTLPDGASVPTTIGGTYTFTVTGEDYAGNVASHTVTYYVHYIFGGVLPPLKDAKAFKLGSTIPVKFQLFDYFGTPIGTAVADLFVTGPGPEIQAPSTTGFEEFRYDMTDQQYIFNLDTKPLSEGAWTMRIALDDGTSHTVPFTLR